MLLLQTLLPLLAVWLGLEWSLLALLLRANLLITPNENAWKHLQ